MIYIYIYIYKLYLRFKVPDCTKYFSLLFHEENRYIKNYCRSKRLPKIQDREKRRVCWKYRQKCFMKLNILLIFQMIMVIDT